MGRGEIRIADDPRELVADRCTLRDRRVTSHPLVGPADTIAGAPPCGREQIWDHAELWEGLLDLVKQRRRLRRIPVVECELRGAQFQCSSFRTLTDLPRALVERGRGVAELAAVSRGDHAPDGQSWIIQLTTAPS